MKEFVLDTNITPPRFSSTYAVTRRAGVVLRKEVAR